MSAQQCPTPLSDRIQCLSCQMCPHPHHVDGASRRVCRRLLHGLLGTHTDHTLSLFAIHRQTPVRAAHWTQVMHCANTSRETQQSCLTFMSLTASATSLRSTVADSRILARASEILMMLSSCLGVAEITCTSPHCLQTAAHIWCRLQWQGKVKSSRGGLLCQRGHHSVPSSDADTRRTLRDWPALRSCR